MAIYKKISTTIMKQSTKDKFTVHVEKKEFGLLGLCMLYALIIIEHQDPRQVPFWGRFGRQCPVPGAASGS